MIDEDELNELFMDSRVTTYLETLEIDVMQSSALFHLLANSDLDVFGSYEFVTICNSQASLMGVVGLPTKSPLQSLHLMACSYVNYPCLPSCLEGIDGYPFSCHHLCLGL